MSQPEVPKPAGFPELELNGSRKNGATATQPSEESTREERISEIERFESDIILDQAGFASLRRKIIKHPEAAKEIVSAAQRILESFE